MEVDLAQSPGSRGRVLHVHDQECGDWTV
jgi:hypothetical protein